ncbi:MAG: hypothetical protein M3R27_09925 [Bacteroidota bacterium]|nr:hypothetical protein [Bacteroidota bacterium]
MKTLISSILLLLIHFLSSCTKYEDGPGFSLLTKKSRLANTWRVESFFLNNNDETYNYRIFITKEELTFSRSGDYSYSESATWSWAKADDKGSWEFREQKEEVNMISEDGSSKNFRILKLKNDQLWLERRVSPDSLVELHYVPLTDN